MNRVPPRRISVSPFFYRTMLPFVYLGLAASFIMAIPGKASIDNWVGVLLVATAFGATSMVMRIFTSGIADEVIDHGDDIEVRIGRKREQIAIRDIQSVSEVALWQATALPTRIELLLQTPCAFGRVVTFMPRGFSLNLFSDHPLCEELSERIRRAQLIQRVKAPS